MNWIFNLTVASFFTVLEASANNTTGTLDVSPMTIRECSARPTNKCGPMRLAQSDCAYLTPKPSRKQLERNPLNNTGTPSLKNNTGSINVQTHVRLWCRSSDVTKQDLVQQIVAIQRRSKNRAVDVHLNASSFGNDTVELFAVLGPISEQVISLWCEWIADPLITSRLHKHINMLRLKLDRGNTALIIRKADFSPLQKIRIIVFDTVPIGALEIETFTDLPNLMTLAVEAKTWFTVTEEAVYLAAHNRLHCDFGNDWFWEWIALHPYLQQDRERGEIFKIGSFVNEPFACFRTDREICGRNGKIIPLSDEEVQVQSTGAVDFVGSSGDLFDSNYSETGYAGIQKCNTRTNTQ